MRAPARAAASTIGSSTAPAGAVPDAPPFSWGSEGPVGADATPSTSRCSRSGAASSSACLIASSSVTAEAAQSEQLPRRLMRATPSSSDSSSTLPPWDSMYGPHVLERALDPLPQRDRVQVVDQQQRRDQLVLGERAGQALALLARREQRADDALEPSAVHLHDRRHELLGELARGGILGRVQRRLQLLYAQQQIVTPLTERRAGHVR